MYQEISIIDDEINLTDKLKKIFKVEKDYIFMLNYLKCQ